MKKKFYLGDAKMWSYDITSFGSFYQFLQDLKLTNW